MKMTMRKGEDYQVITEHKASYPYSVEFRIGEKVTVSDKREDGWVWCTNKDRIGAWVPEKCLIQEDHTGTMLCEYSSTELTVMAGERLKLIKEESGWVLCVNQKGKEGWIPCNKVRKLH